MPAPPASASTGNSIFSGVNLNAPATTPAGYGGFKFGSSAPAPAAAASSAKKPTFSFASTPAPATAAATKPAYPSFALPAAASKTPVVPKPSTNEQKPSGSIDSNKKLIECAEGFRKYISGQKQLDVVACQRFITTFCAIYGTGLPTVTEAVKTTTTAKSPTTWDPNRPLFGGAKPLVSPTAGSSNSSATTTNTSLFGGSSASPAPATGGFSFNPTKSAASPAPAPGVFSFKPTNTGAAAAPVPAFSFSTTQSPAVRAAAKTPAVSTTASASKLEGDNDDTNNEEDGDGELEAANDDYKVLYKTKTKVLRVSKGIYIKGVLKLEKHKESGKYRLVVRDPTVGTVKLNTAISKDMPLSKHIFPATKKKGPTPMVIIKAVFDEDSGAPEDFKIITSKEEHENLYNELKKLV